MRNIFQPKALLPKAFTSNIFYFQYLLNPPSIEKVLNTPSIPPMNTYHTYHPFLRIRCIQLSPRNRPFPHFRLTPNLISSDLISARKWSLRQPAIHQFRNQYIFIYPVSTSLIISPNRPVLEPPSTIENIGKILRLIPYIRIDERYRQLMRGKIHKSWSWIVNCCTFESH